MTDEMKPVHCGCGGEAKVISYLSREYCKMAYYVRCVECGTETDDLHSEAEAVTAWNRAMGVSKMENTTERTAKVENIGDYRLPINDYCFIKKGDCGNCGFVATEGDKYCRECGARLEWE